jgi:hypothetical protein
MIIIMPREISAYEGHTYHYVPHNYVPGSFKTLLMTPEIVTSECTYGAVS